jgi:mono/diheme cytochrome c family protein
MEKSKKISLIGLLFLPLVILGCATSGTSSSSAPTSSQPTQSQTSLDGKTLYASNCASCHGTNGEGGSASALNANQNVQDLINTTKNGISPVMPSFASQFNEAQIKAIADYVVSLKK